MHLDVFTEVSIAGNITPKQYLELAFKVMHADPKGKTINFSDLPFTSSYVLDPLLKQLISFWKYPANARAAYISFLEF